MIMWKKNYNINNNNVYLHKNDNIKQHKKQQTNIRIQGSAKYHLHVGSLKIISCECIKIKVS